MDLAPPRNMKVAGLPVALPCRAHSGLAAGIARLARSMLREFPISPPDPLQGEGVCTLFHETEANAEPGEGPGIRGNDNCITLSYVF